MYNWGANLAYVRGYVHTSDSVRTNVIRGLDTWARERQYFQYGTDCGISCSYTQVCLLVCPSKKDSDLKKKTKTKKRQMIALQTAQNKLWRQFWIFFPFVSLLFYLLACFPAWLLGWLAGWLINWLVGQLLVPLFCLFVRSFRSLFIFIVFLFVFLFACLYCSGLGSFGGTVNQVSGLSREQWDYNCRTSVTPFVF